MHTISKPKEPSTMSNKRSAIFPISTIQLRSLLHLTKVNCDWSFCFMFCIILLSKVVLPTPRGPDMATMTGGRSSSGARLTRRT